MEKDLLKTITPGLIAFKYASFFWAIYIYMDASGIGLEILTKLLIYWYWLTTTALTIAITAILIKLIPRHTETEKERIQSLVDDVFKDIPLLKFLEGNIYISKSITIITTILVLATLHSLALTSLFTSLLIPAIINLILMLIFKYIE